MRGALATLAVGCAGVAASPTWPTFLGAVLLTGTGIGASGLDSQPAAGCDRVTAPGSPAEHRERSLRRGRSGRALRRQHAQGRDLDAWVCRCGCTRLRAGASAVSVPPPPRDACKPLPDKANRRSRKLTSEHGTLARLGLAYLCYVGAEAGTAGWIVAHLSALGYSARLATAVTSGFWLALTIGPLCVAPLGNVVTLRNIVLASTALLTASLAVAAIPVLAPVAYVAAGLAAAPIFPMGLAWAAQTWPGDHRTASWAVTASMLGGVVGPAIIAGAVSATNVMVVPVALSAFAGADLRDLAVHSRPHQPRR